MCDVRIFDLAQRWKALGILVRRRQGLPENIEQKQIKTSRKKRKERKK